jgi:hypothetical protein
VKLDERFSEWRSGLGLVLDVPKDTPPRFLAVGWRRVGTWLALGSHQTRSWGDGCVQSGPVLVAELFSSERREDESANSVSTNARWLARMRRERDIWGLATLIGWGLVMDLWFVLLFCHEHELRYLDFWTLNSRRTCDLPLVHFRSIGSWLIPG